MKKIIIGLFCLPWALFGQVNYVGTWGGLNTNNVNTNNASTLSSGTIPLVVENPVVITNSTPTVNFGALTLGFGSTSPNGIAFNAGGDTLPFIGPTLDGDGVLFNCSFGSSYFNDNGSLVGDGTMLAGVGLLASQNLWAGSNTYTAPVYGTSQTNSGTICAGKLTSTNMVIFGGGLSVTISSNTIIVGIAGDSTVITTNGVSFTAAGGGSFIGNGSSLTNPPGINQGGGALAGTNAPTLNNVTNRGTTVFSGGLYGLAQGVAWTNGSATPFLANGVKTTVPAGGIITLSMTITNAETVFLTNTTSGDCAILGPISSLTTTAAGVFGMITVTSGDVVEITNVAVTAAPVIVRCQFHAFR